MAQTCRTCKHTDPGCLMRIRGRQGLDCYYYEARETPLLVDELAYALRRLIQPVDGVEVMDWGFYTTVLNNREKQAQVALARYKEEMGDAEV